MKNLLLSTQLRELPDPSCTSCHANFMPLGYALENFDPLGRWRTEVNGESIDASAELPDGRAFDGPAGLRQALVERRDAFLTTITERLMAYAQSGSGGIFQPTPPERMPGVRTVLRNAEKQGYTWSAVLAGIVGSSVPNAK